MDFKVADLSLADFGRTEIQLAEHEMPGLMAMRERYGDSKPLAGARIAGSLHMTDPDRRAHRDARRARRRGPLGLLQHLLDPGPRRRGGRGRPGGHRRRPAGVPVFAWKGETLEEYWWCTQQILQWPGEHVRQHDPRRRRRRHDAASTSASRRRRPARRPTRPPPRATEQRIVFEVLNASLAESQRPLDPDRRRDQGRHRGDHHRRAPSLRDDARGLAALPGASTSTTRSPSRSSTTSTAAATRSSTASTAPPTC